MLAAGGKGVLGSWEARAKWVRGLMVVEIAVGLFAKAPVHSCTVVCSMCRIVALDGREACGGESLPRIAIRLFNGLDSSVAANRDSGAGWADVTACKASPFLSQSVVDKIEFVTHTTAVTVAYGSDCCFLLTADGVHSANHSKADIASGVGTQQEHSMCVHVPGMCQIHDTFPKRLIHIAGH